MTPDEMKLLLDVQSDAFQRNIDSFIKLMNDKIESNAKAVCDMQRKHDAEINELKKV